jgi:putative oxidoreductase
MMPRSMEGWMFKRLRRWSPQILSLMRIALGVTFIEHGTQKLLGFPVAAPGLALPLLLFTGVLETVGGTLVALGLLTRIAAFVLSGELAVGYWWIHVPRSFYPLANGGEVMVLYCFVFLYIAAVGAGPWSLDARMKSA